MNETQQMIQTSKKITDLQKWLLDALLVFMERVHGDKVKDAALKKLINHMKNGGECEIMSFPMDDIDFVENLLRSRNILAYSMDSTNPETNRSMRSYIIRKSDYQKIQAIADDYLRHLDGECHELDLDTFMSANEDKAYFAADGLSAAEMNVFRENALNYNMDFVFVRSTDENKEDRTYKVLANDKDALDKCLIDTYADLVGKEGEAYMEKMNVMWENQNKMLSQLRRAPHTMFVIDAANMNSVIEIGVLKNGVISDNNIKPEDHMKGKKYYRSHRLGIRSEKHRDGTTTNIPIDEGTSVNKELDKSILSEMRKMERPVILTQEEAMQWLQYKEKDNEGKLLLPEVFADNIQRRDFIRSLEDRQLLPVIKPLHAREERARNGMRTYSDLPYSVVSALARKKIEGVYIVGRDVAYVPEKEAEVREVLNDIYYQDCHPLDAIADELKFAGRGNGRLRNLEKDEEYVLFDYSNPDILLDISTDKVVFSDGTEHAEVMVEDVSLYEHAITDTVGKMQTPIIMSKDDYISTARDEVALSLLTATNSALLIARTKDAEQKHHYHELAEIADDGGRDNLSLSVDDQAVLDRRAQSPVTIQNYQNDREERDEHDERDDRGNRRNDDRDER